MNSLDEVPFRIPTDSPEAPPEEAELLSAPEPTGPDYLRILRETEYEFRLEKGVLAGLLGGNPGVTWPAPVHLPCGPPPSCPPYWLMFNSPQESRRNSDLWEPGPRQRSHSLNTADLRCLHPRVKFIISDSEGEDGYSEDDEGSPSEDNAQGRRSPWPGDQAPMLKAFRHGSSPHLLGSSSPCGLARLRPGSPSVFPDSRRSPQPSRAGSPQCKGQRHPKRKPHLQASVSRRHSLTPQPTCFSPTSLPPPRPSTAGHIPSKSRKPAAPSPSPCSCLPPPYSVTRPQGSHTPLQDSSAELLSALSQEERELLEAITEQGYSLRTAIMALQKTGRQSPEQILGYLVACNRLCDLGYDEAQVEEALEMFQNCETKAAEFLCLLTQFNEMGFQQSAIKEVLLVHENHRERALEELMTREA